MPKSSDFEEVYKKFLEEYGKEKGESVYFSWLNEHGYDDSKQMHGQKSKKERKESFSGDLFEFKEENGEFYVKGLIATTHPDKVGDVIPYKTLVKLKEQWDKNLYGDTTTGSIHHKREDKDLVMIGNGKSEIKSLGDGYYGLGVEFLLNKTHPEFEKVSYEIKNKFLSGFSIEYMTNKAHNENIGGKEYRILDDIALHGNGLANPRAIVNPYARFEEFGYKELVKFDNEQKANLSGEVEAKMGESVSVEVKEKPVEAKEAAKQPDVDVKEMVEKMIQEKVSLAFKEAMKSMPPANTPMQTKESTAKEVGLEFKEYSKAIKALKEGKISSSMAFKEAANLVNKHFKFDYDSCRTYSSLSKKEFYENTGMEFKAALATTTNEPTNFYVTTAELGDVFGTAVQSHMNNVAKTWAAIPEETPPGSEIAFRFRSTRFSPGGYAQNAALGTAENVTVVKAREDYAEYRSYFDISGKMLAEAARQDGLGNLWAQYAEWCASDLGYQLNYDILNGDTTDYVGTNESYILGLRHICGSSGSIFGLARATYSTLNGTTSAQSSAPLSLSKLRDMRMTAFPYGADPKDCVYVMNQTQVGFYLAILQRAQLQPIYSNRAGFEGVLEFDSIPIIMDKDCPSDYVYHLDLSVLRKAVLQPPVFTDVAVTKDSRGAFLKTYVNLWCKDPQRCVLYTGFATS